MSVTGRLLGFEVEGYRSLRAVRVESGPITVLVGDNGAGKSNIFRALELIAAAGEGSLCRRLAGEGGLASVLWSGGGGFAPSSRIRLTARFDNIAYRIEIAAPVDGEAALDNEPVVRDEHLYRIGQRGTTQILRREGSSIWLRDANGKRHDYQRELLPSETAIAAFRDSALHPELAYLRQLLAEWRFYPGFHIGDAAPARGTSLAVASPALAADGGDLAAILATHARLADTPGPVGLALADAFPGSRLDVRTVDGKASFTLTLPEHGRALAPHEISEGTMQYICLAAALSAFRPPRLIALNEPEAGLNPRLMTPLARLIARATTQSQVWVVTHSAQLAEAIRLAAGVAPTLIVKEGGATTFATAPPPSSLQAMPAIPSPPPVVATVAPSVAAALHGASTPLAPKPVLQPMAPPAPPVESMATMRQAPPEADNQQRVLLLRETLSEITRLLEGHRMQPGQRHLLVPELNSRIARLRALGAEVPVELTILMTELDRETSRAAHG